MLTSAGMRDDWAGSVRIHCPMRGKIPPPPGGPGARLAKELVVIERMRKRLQQLALALGLIALGWVIGRGGIAPHTERAAEPVDQARAQEFEALCTRVIDGDTIELADGEHVRYIGMDTPEMRPVEAYAKAATEANRELVEGKTVRLVLDVEKRDRYGRLLAYVYVDGTFVNAELVRRGLAQVATYPPNVRHQDHFLKLQRQAREAGRGLWSDPPEEADRDGGAAGVGDSAGQSG